MHVVEVSLGEGSAMSHSGVQVEYVSAARVESVWPSSGSVSGGTVVTLSGEGFVAGQTACRFGSAESTEAVVLSSSEAHCVSGAAVRGGVLVSVSTGGVGSEYSGVSFEYAGALGVERVTPVVADTMGGSVVSVVSAGVVDGSSMKCAVGVVEVEARAVQGGVVECMVAAATAGNQTVSVSSNGQDWSVSTGVMLESVGSMNVSSVDPAVVLGGSKVTLTGAGFSAARGVYCGVGGSSLDGSSWVYSKGSVVSSSSVECALPS